MKRVLLIVVDGCTSRVLGPALERGELPVLGELSRRGTLRLDCLSIFPSITPAATASIVTGRYPAAHGIAGMSWWDERTGDVEYFGDDVGTVLRKGIGGFLRDFLRGLNGERLRALTMFQRVERAQQQAACFNHLIFKGDVEHEVTPPSLLRWLPWVDSSITVHGPSWLCLGDLITTTRRAEDPVPKGGAFHRFGLDDAGTEALLCGLPNAAALPAFSVAYFADYDFESHDRGPESALDTLRALDGRLGHIFDHWGGIDRVLEDVGIVLTADHSHSEVGRSDEADIVLEDLLSEYRLADPAKGWRDGDDLLLCPNMRCAEIYLRQPTRQAIERLCHTLCEDPRVDHLIWRNVDDEDEYAVMTGDRGQLRFRHAGDDSGALRDEYGGRWRIDGEHGALELSLSGGEVSSASYPNALERIANGVDHPRVGRVWATARPGSEFRMPGQSVHHRGGSHGTLHALDSIVPLLVSGQIPSPALSCRPRIVDAVPLCAAFLDIPHDRDAGAPHDARS